MIPVSVRDQQLAVTVDILQEDPTALEALLDRLEGAGIYLLPGLARALFRHPATAQQFVESTRVAREWSRHGDGWVRCPTTIVVLHVGTIDHAEPYAYVYMAEDGHWVVEVLQVELDDTWFTPGEAREAADRELARLEIACVGGAIRTDRR